MVGVSWLQKVKWLSAFVEAHQAVFRAENIEGGLHEAGIFPLEPSKILNWITLPSPPYQSWESTPLIATPFNKSILTSSPLDHNAVHIANNALNHLVISGASINSPPRKYITCHIRRSEHLNTANTILWKENKALQTVVTARKAEKSGKRRIIEGKHLLTTVKIRKAIEDAENITKKRKG